MNHLGLRIGISIAWLIVAIVCLLFLIIPCTNISHSGNVYFDNKANYDAFKKTIANSSYTIDKLDVINDGGYLVMFDVRTPKTAEFPYGERYDPTIAFIALTLIGSVILVAITGYAW